MIVLTTNLDWRLCSVSWMISTRQHRTGQHKNGLLPVGAPVAGTDVLTAQPTWLARRVYTVARSGLDCMHPCPAIKLIACILLELITMSPRKPPMLCFWPLTIVIGAGFLKPSALCSRACLGQNRLPSIRAKSSCRTLQLAC